MFHLTGLIVSSEIVLFTVFSLYLEDFLFYWSHRALHLPYLYKYVHKTHHE